MCKQKTFNRVILNGDDNENGFKTNRLSQKNKLHVQHMFSSNWQKQICTCSMLFCLSLAVVLRNCNDVLYDQNVKRPSYTLFLWRNCRMCLPNILFPVFMFAFIFTAASISHFLIAALNFHVFLPTNFQ